MGNFKFGFDKLGRDLQGWGPGPGDRRRARFGGPVIPLRYQGEGRFVSAVDDEHEITFKTGAGGSADLVMHYYEGVISAHKAG